MSVKIKVPNIGTIKIGGSGIKFIPPVKVQGYIRQDGTYVRGHYRAR
jgi:hypothetical protein